MAKNFILILGGARSGKSTFAQDIAPKLGGKVLFVATAEPLDSEMASRIEHHKRTRPENWRTLEIGIEVGQKLKDQIKDSDAVLLDCLTLLVSNILTKEDTEPSFDYTPPPLHHDEHPPSHHCEDSTTCHCEERSDEAISRAENRVMTEMEALIKCIDKHKGTFIVVSNEVGLGLVPDNKLGRIYRDLLGRANQLLAQHASEVYFMASGIPLKIKG